MDRDPALLSAPEIRATAELARLLVTDHEVEKLRGELSAVLSYVAQISEIDVTGVPPMTHGAALVCPLRADVVGAHDALAGALRNAPATEGAFFSVPAILAGAERGAVAGDSGDEGGSQGRG